MPSDARRRRRRLPASSPTIYMHNMPLFRASTCVALRRHARRRPPQAQAEKFGIAGADRSTRCWRARTSIWSSTSPCPNAHFAVSHAALSAGKHVFSEKPLCVTAKDGAAPGRRGDARGLEARLRARHVPWRAAGGWRAR